MITLIVMAGLAGLSPEPFESAHVDGANEAQILWRVTLPMVLPTIFTAMVLRSIDGLKTFDIIYAMTGGGPGYASETLNIMAFKYSFEYFRMGQSSVILVFLFLVVLLFSLGHPAAAEDCRNDEGQAVEEEARRAGSPPRS